MKTTIEKQTNPRIATFLIAIFLLSLASLASAQSSPQSVAKARPQRLVLVSIADRKLAVIENGNVLAYFTVAVGAAVSPSSTGEFEIVSRVANPTYYHDGIVMGPGKDNPVGTRWLGLNVKGYGIHGTNAPRSVGARDFTRMHTVAESGCGAALCDVACGRCGGDSRRTG